MQNIKSNIKQFLEKISKEETVLRYVYNNKFVPGESTVYYSGPYWDTQEIVAAVNTLITGKWLSSGENVHKFEIEFCKKFNQNYGVMVNSGSSANLVMIGALKKYFDWQDEDEVIVSPVGFPTTIAPIIQYNLKPVFVDIELETLNFNVTKIEEKITSKTKAIFISPVLGNPPCMDTLISLSDKYKLKLVLDNCDSLGSTWEDKYLTNYCVAASHSFYPAHHISTGEGGMVTSNNEEIISIARSLSWWGRDCYCVGAANLLSCGTCKNRFDNWLENYNGIVDHKYVFNNLGYNLKPLDLQGSIGLIQLSKWEEIDSKRKENYYKMISNFYCLYEKGIKFVSRVSNKSVPSWFGVPIICDNKEIKDSLVKYLEDNRIQTRNYFAGNILLHPGYSKYGNYKDYPIANTVLDKVFFVGCPPHYNMEICNYIHEKVKLWKK